MIPGYPYASLRVIPTVAGLVVIGICALGGATAIALAARRGRGGEGGGGGAGAADRGPGGAGGGGRGSVGAGGRRPGDLWLICGLAAAVPVGLAIYSSLGTDIWDARDLYASVPAGVLVIGVLLAAIPSRLRVIAVAAVLATLVAGTIRGISPRYGRPPFRAAAGYLDRVAGPRDPIIIYPSFLGLDADLPIEFQKPHLVINGIPAAWPAAPPGGLVVAVLDGHPGGPASTPLPRPSGYELVGSRQYGGLVPFMLLTYRPVGS